MGWNHQLEDIAEDTRHFGKIAMETKTSLYFDLGAPKIRNQE